MAWRITRDTPRNVFDRLRENDLWWYSLWLMLSARIGDLVNLVISAFLVPDFMNQGDMGAILPLTRAINIATIPITVAAAVFLRYSSKFEAWGQPGKTNKMMRDFLTAGLLLGGVALGLFTLLSKPLGKLYGVSDIRVLWVVGGLAFLAAVGPSLQTAIQALQRYRMFVYGNVAGPTIRLIAAWLLLTPLQITGLFIANALASLTRIVLMGVDALPFVFSRKSHSPYRQHVAEMIKFALPFGIYTTLITTQLFIEASVVRTALGEKHSAGFFMITTLGSAPMYLLAALTPLLLPVLSHRHERKQGSRQTHVLMLGCALTLGLAITLLLYLIGPFFFSLRKSWMAFAEFGPLLWLLGLAYCLTAVDSIHRVNLHAKSSFQYLLYFAPVQILGMAALFLLPKFNESWLTLNVVIFIMITTRLLNLLGLLIDLWLDRHAANQPNSEG